MTAGFCSEKLGSTAHCLTLHRFGVAYGDRPVLAEVDLEIASRGVVALVGPTGSGKSTLLRTIAGFNRHMPSLTSWGEARYRGETLEPGNFPVLVSQNTRLLTSTLLENLLYETPEQFAATPEEKRARALATLRDVGLERFGDSLFQPVVTLPLAVQRLVAIARAIACGPALVLIDEPTFGLDEAGAQAVLEVIRRQSAERAVLVVLHNQNQARALGGSTALLAGGVIREIQPTDRFFDHPQTPAAREFVATGTCSDPSPGAQIEDLDAAMVSRLRPPPAGKPAPSASLGPRGFVWLLEGKLAGTPQPGIVADIHYDLQALRRVGVSDLISLTEAPLDSASLAGHGIAAHWFPIPDAQAPEMSQAFEICSTIDRLLQRDAVIAVHCRAGLGRTGTILVAYLIWCGKSAIDALETARRFEPKWVQSAAQVKFLESFAQVERDLPGGDCSCHSIQPCSKPFPTSPSAWPRATSI